MRRPAGERSGIFQRLMMSLSGIVISAMVLLISGCGQFFVPENNNSGGTTGSNRVYVANATTSSIAAFTIGTSALSAVSGSPFSLGYTPLAAVMTPSNSFLYVAGPDAIYGYTINSDGSLSAVSGGPGVAAISVVALEVSPDGKWLFGLDSLSQTVDEYQINTSTGGLTGVTPLAYSFKSGIWLPRALKVSPSGGYLFAALGTAGDVVFTFNTSTGALAQSQTLGLDSQTSDNALAVDSTSSYLYIARSGTTGGVAAYSIGASGALNSITGSPFTAGQQPFSLTINSSGKYIYAANRSDGTISGYAIGTGSVLTALTGSPYTAGTLVNSLAVDNTGTYLLAGANGGSPDLSMYTFDSTTAGKLNLATSTTTGTDPTGVVAVVTTH